MPWLVSGERLWVKPAVMTVLSIAAAFVAKLADRTELAEFVPSVTAESVEKLLSVMAASMLVIATFAVASMVSASWWPPCRGPSCRQGGRAAPACDRVDVPAVTMLDMFDDAFTGIARDGAAAVEVAVRLQKALQSLAAVGDADMRAAALEHSRRALARAEHAMTLPDDVAAVRAAAASQA